MAEFAATRQPSQTRTSDSQRSSTSRVSRGPVSLSSDLGRLSRSIGNRTLHRVLRSHSVQPQRVQRTCAECEKEKLQRHGEESLTGGFGIKNLSKEDEKLVVQLRASDAPTIQRVCEKTPPPPDLGCDQATSSTGTGTNILFGLDSDALPPAQQSTLSAIAAGWHRGGQVAVLRIDGFASCDGAADRNWRLSCRRAQTVARELEAPSDGTPGVATASLQTVAHGETDSFDARALPPNRRVVVTGGGTPPPGPTCGLTVTGPTDLDHYCAAYVPSNAASCGVFPAPNITLTATGAASGATLRWSIARGTSRASIVGPIIGPSVTILGDAASVTQGDVTVQVTDGTCTTPHFLTVRQPSQMSAAPAPSSGATFIQSLITYTVSDQFGNPMGAGICIDETVTICRTNRPRATPVFGDAPTNASGQAQDQLQYSNGAGIPADLCIKLDQVLTAGGCGPLLHNTILYRPTGITLTHGASCAVGDPCA